MGNAECGIKNTMAKCRLTGLIMVAFAKLRSAFRIPHSAFNDLRYGARMLIKNPGFTLIAVITLALGIGANTAIFTVINAVLLKSVPYQDPERIVLLWGEVPSLNEHHDQVSATDVADWRKLNSVFEDVATYKHWGATLSGEG